MANSAQRLLRQARRLTRSAATQRLSLSENWPDPRFSLFGGVAAGFNSRADELLIAGPAGTGKTLANLLRVYWVCRKYPGARVLIVRKTRESLTETVLVTWERDVLGASHPILTRRPILRRVRQNYPFPNGSVVVLGGMDKPDKVLSSEFDLIYIPEATELDLVDWETLGGRLRAGAVPYQQLIADCNPTTPHLWLYQRCQAGGCKLFPTTHQDNPRFWDRALGKWTPAGEQYLARLERMTGARRDRFLKGLWVAAEGVVYEYDPAVHLLPNSWRAPREWPRVWGIDWGKTAPTVLCVWAVDPEGRMYACREVYQTRLRPDVLGKRAKSWVETGEEPHPRAIVCDHDEERKHDFEKASGLVLQLADKRDRDKGIESLQARFDVADDGKPRIFLRERARDHEADRFLVESGRPTCGVEELLGYVWNPDFLADEPIAENDHFCFVAGTCISTDRGSVAIERIERGDRVRTRAGFHPVVACGRTSDSAPVMTVEFDNGAALTATGNHPVWIEGTGFVRLEALRQGERVLSLSDQPVRVLKLREESEPQPVFNLTVAGQPEFFANGLLVHNCDQMRYSARYVDSNLLAMNDDEMPEVGEPLLPAWMGTIR